MPEGSGLPIGDAAYWACVLEVCAPKVGNVHPGARFADATWRDFITSAQAIAPILDRAPSRPVGQTIRDCVAATRGAAASNTNLGMILLLSPLAAAGDGPMDEGIERVLAGLSIEDARLAYEAIALARPGGLGDAAAQDVRAAPTVTLLAAMRLAADRDAIARQYAESFSLVTQTIPVAWRHDLPLSMAIVDAHLKQMSREPDSLIVRKCGAEIGNEAMRRAMRVLSTGWPMAAQSGGPMRELDQWLRADGHRRNPGTSADLIAAALFVMLRRGTIAPPFAWAERMLQCA